MIKNPEFDTNVHRLQSLTYIWCVKFDHNIFNNIKTNVAILQYKADIA